MPPTSRDETRESGGPRFYVEPPLRSTPGGAVTLSSQESRHAVRVLRLEAGAAVTLMDGEGTLAGASLIEADPRRAVCRVEAVQNVEPPGVRVTLATAIPKGPRGDAMVEAVSQLGADLLVPLASRHAVVRPGEGKLERYRRAAIESAKQCGRAWAMRVEEAASVEDVLQEGAKLKLLLDPDGEPTRAVMEGLTGPVGPVVGVVASVREVREVREVMLLVGPEGGWHERERAAAEAAGCVPWRIGPHVLRIETAAAAGVAVVRALLT